MSVAGVVVYYNDIDMLIRQVGSGQFDLYDAVYIVDGPYVYTKRLEFGGEQNDRFSDTVFGKELLKIKKYKYVYQVWKNEFEKRVFSYQMVVEDLIVLHDTDEFYDMKEKSLTDFSNSKYSVGSFACQNLYLDGFSFSKPLYAVNDWAKLPLKPFIFKRGDVGPAEHINYLWLVGVDQGPKDREKIKREALFGGYHFTGMRSAAGQRQKFIFYNSLYMELNVEKKFPIINRLKAEIDSGNLSFNLAEEIYLSSIAGYFGVPGLEQADILTPMLPLSARLSVTAAEVASQRNQIYPKSTFMVPGLGAYFLIYKDSFVNELRFEKSRRLRIKKWTFNVGFPLGECVAFADTITSLKFETNFSEGVHVYLYQINIDGDVALDPLIKVEIL